MAKGNKDAKRLRDVYGVKYQAALNLIRERGLEAAIAQCEEWKKKEDEQPSSQRRYVGDHEE